MATAAQEKVLEYLRAVVVDFVEQSEQKVDMTKNMSWAGLDLYSAPPMTPIWPLDCDRLDMPGPGEGLWRMC